MVPAVGDLSRAQPTDLGRGTALLGTVVARVAPRVATQVFLAGRSALVAHVGVLVGRGSARLRAKGKAVGSQRGSRHVMRGHPAVSPKTLGIAQEGGPTRGICPSTFSTLASSGAKPPVVLVVS